MGTCPGWQDTAAGRIRRVADRRRRDQLKHWFTTAATAPAGLRHRVAHAFTPGRIIRTNMSLSRLSLGETRSFGCAPRLTMCLTPQYSADNNRSYTDRGAAMLKLGQEPGGADAGAFSYGAVQVLAVKTGRITTGRLQRSGQILALVLVARGPADRAQGGHQPAGRRTPAGRRLCD
jgi:hypothetical protein